jgi:hypothetical protein
VVDVEDYHVKGSFDPAASCDTEFFGYRETTFKVESAEGKDAIGYWPLDESELEYFLKHNDDKLTLIVQDAIDKQNGDV